MAIRRAERRQVAAKIALSGPSGSGKTLTALRIALAMAGKLGGRVVVIDSEAGSAETYTGERFGDVTLDYDVLPLETYDVDAYLTALEEAAGSGGHSVVILDSASHLWAGVGGLLEEVDKARDKYGEGWRKATPKYNRFISAVLRYPKHLIVTLRSKQAYVQEKDNQGKTVIRKVGMESVMRDGFEYEVSLAFTIDEDHTARVSKTRIRALDGFVREKAGPEIAEAILAWLDGATAPALPPSAQQVRAAIVAAIKRDDHAWTQEQVAALLAVHGASTAADLPADKAAEVIARVASKPTEAPPKSAPTTPQATPNAPDPRRKFWDATGCNPEAFDLYRASENATPLADLPADMLDGLIEEYRPNSASRKAFEKWAIANAKQATEAAK